MDQHGSTWIKHSSAWMKHERITKSSYRAHVTLRTWEVLKLLTRFTPKFRSVKKLKVTFPRNRSTHLPCDATRARPRSARACSVRRAVVVSHLESKLATLHSCTRSNDDYLQSRPSSGKLGERTVDFELERKRACTHARARARS